MQRADGLRIARQGFVGGAGFGQKPIAGAEGNDRVDDRIHPLDVVKEGSHHLDGRHLPRADRGREAAGGPVRDLRRMDPGRRRWDEFGHGLRMAEAGGGRYGATFPGSILGNPLPSSILLIFGSSI